MQSNRFFAPFALASLLSFPSPVFSEEVPLSDAVLRTMETGLPLSVSIRGRFRYAAIGGTGDWADTFLCETDMGSSGGEFCFFSTNGNPRALQNEVGEPACVYYCLPEEWYRLADAAGNTNPVVVAMRPWHDGTDEAGFEKEAFISVFRFEDGNVAESKLRPSFAGLIADSSFVSLERLSWHFARKSGTGGWSVDAGPSVPDLDEPHVPEPERIAALAAFLHDRTNAPPVAASNVVFEADAGRDPFFALVSDGTDATEDGCLWIPFLWNGTEWTDAPTNGFACASGRCPASFRAATNEFYRLSLSGELPRLVVLKNRNGNLRETFWETALGPKAALLDFEKGMPDTEYLVGSGFPSVPRSVLQSLAHLGMWFPFMRLERIVPEQLPLVPSEPL